MLGAPVTVSVQDMYTPNKSAHKTGICPNVESFVLCQHEIVLACKYCR